MFKNALTTGTMDAGAIMLPDYSKMAPAEVDTQGNDLQPEKMSPMDSLRASTATTSTLLHCFILCLPFH